MDETTIDAGATSAPPPPPQPPPAGPAVAPPRPPLRRSRDRKLFGVAGGLARYFGIDPLLVRIAFVVLAISGAGAGVLLYLACALLVPGEAAAPGASAAPGSQADPHPPGTAFVDRHGKVLAIIGSIIALSALLSSSGPFGWGDHDNGFWGLLWVGVLVTVIVLVAMEVQSRREARRARATDVAAQEPWPTQSYATAPYATQPYAAPATAAQPQTPPVVLPAPQPPPPAEPPSGLGVITLGTALLVAGTLVGLDRGDVVDVPAVVVLGSALSVVAGGLVVSAFAGRARWLIPLGVVLALATSAASVDLPGNGQVGEVEWRPTTVAEVETVHEWGVGDATLDLTDVGDLADVTADPAISTSVEMAMGSLTVIVPEDVALDVDAHVGTGNIVGVEPDDVGGFSRDASATLPAIPTKEGAASELAPTPTIDLDLRVGVGEVRVSRVAS